MQRPHPTHQRRSPGRLLVLALLAVAAWLATPAQAELELNTATAAQLAQLPGVGPRLAERIVAARGATGFTHWDELVHQVTGLGPVRAARLSVAGVTVACAAYAATDAMLAAPQPKKDRTSSRKASVSDSPSAISSRVNSASKSR